MLSLKEILEAKKRGEVLTIPSSIPQDKDDIKEEEITYINNTASYLNSSTKHELFLSVYSILIKNPYQCIITFREFRNSILENDIYVLNTFTSLNIDAIAKLYLEVNPPRTAYNMHQLWMALSEIHLCIPAMYYKDIEQIILKNRG